MMNGIIHKYQCKVNCMVIKLRNKKREKESKREREIEFACMPAIVGLLSVRMLVCSSISSRVYQMKDIKYYFCVRSS